MIFQAGNGKNAAQLKGHGWKNRRNDDPIREVRRGQDLSFRWWTPLILKLFERAPLC